MWTKKHLPSFLQSELGVARKLCRGAGDPWSVAVAHTGEEEAKTTRKMPLEDHLHLFLFLQLAGEGALDPYSHTEAQATLEHQTYFLLIGFVNDWERRNLRRRRRNCDAQEKKKPPRLPNASTSLKVVANAV